MTPTARTIPHAAASDPAVPVRALTVERSATWLERGFKDFVAHPGIGLTYGAFFAAFGWFLTFGLHALSMDSLILPLASGFMLIAPLAAIGLYEVSRRREEGSDDGLTLARTFAAIGRNPSQIGDMGFVLMLLFFVWIQLALIVFGLFFGGRPPALTEFWSQIVMAPQGPIFLIVGTLVGGAVAVVAFALSVVSMPMLMDRDVSAMTAMRTSLKAVWVNRLNMIGWAATLASLGMMGIAFFFAGLAVTLPIAAHASWHAYRDLVGR